MDIPRKEIITAIADSYKGAPVKQGETLLESLCKSTLIERLFRCDPSKSVSRRYALAIVEAQKEDYSDIMNR